MRNGNTVVQPGALSEMGGDTRQLPSLLTQPEFALLRTVVYASLFHFPMTPEEAAFAGMGTNMSPQTAIETYRDSPALQRILEFRDGYFFPRGRGAWIRLRRWRKRHSLHCLQQNRRVLQLIAGLPLVRLAAFSGSAAHLNVGRQGDLDLLIVTNGQRVWSVAVMALLVAKLWRRRRMICLNYLLSDQRLHLDALELFDTNQLIHLKPIRGPSMYRRVLQANPGVAEFYPRAFALAPAEASWAASLQPPRWLLQLSRPLTWLLSGLIGRPFEWACRKAYRGYLRRRSGLWQSPREVRLEDAVLKLHTESHRKTVVRRYQAELEATLARIRGD